MWAAPHVDRPIQAKVVVPGSKSATARALVLSALAETPSVIRQGLRARDTSLMIDALRGLGASIDDHDPEVWKVRPIEISPTDLMIDCGLAGTVMRFLPPVACLSSHPVWFGGDEEATARPVAPLLEALTSLGAQVEGTRLPFRVSGPITAREVVIDASSSSQFISALLLAGPRFPEWIHLTHRGGPLPSGPHIDMTVSALERRGVRVRRDHHCWEIEHSLIRGCQETIEPDLTTAAVFLAAGLATGGNITVADWPRDSLQPGAHILTIMEDLGAEVTHSDQGLQVSATGQIPGFDIDLHHLSEVTPVMAALAVLAQGESRIRGVAHIRGHETNRLAAISTQITALGGICRETDDGLLIRPAQLHGGLFQSYADHRMAHMGALLGLRIPAIEIDDISCTSKTMPEFGETWTTMVS